VCRQKSATCLPPALASQNKVAAKSFNHECACFELVRPAFLLSKPDSAWLNFKLFAAVKFQQEPILAA